MTWHEAVLAWIAFMGWVAAILFYGWWRIEEKYAAGTFRRNKELIRLNQQVLKSWDQCSVQLRCARSIIAEMIFTGPNKPPKEWQS